MILNFICSKPNVSCTYQKENKICDIPENIILEEGECPYRIEEKDNKVIK